MFGEMTAGTMDSVLQSCRTDSGLFQIIICSDGGYQIAIDGEPIACFYWKRGELDSCRRTFARLTGGPERVGG
jgi:hypothetical protein